MKHTFPKQLVKLADGWVVVAETGEFAPLEAALSNPAPKPLVSDSEKLPEWPADDDLGLPEWPED